MCLLTGRRIDVTAHMLKTMKLKNLPNINREELFEALQKNKPVLPARIRPKKSEESFVPGLCCAKPLESLNLNGQILGAVQAMPSWTVKNTFIHVEDEDLAIVLKINQFLVAFQFPCECLHFYFTSDTSMHL